MISFISGPHRVPGTPPGSGQRLGGRRLQVYLAAALEVDLTVEPRHVAHEPSQLGIVGRLAGEAAVFERSAAIQDPVTSTRVAAGVIDGYHSRHVWLCHH